MGVYAELCRLLVKAMKHCVVVMMLVRAAVCLQAPLPLSLDQFHETSSSSFEDGSAPQFHRSLPGPPLDDGTPTRLYSLSLGRVWHNHTENIDATAAIEEKKAMRRHWQGRRSLYLTMEDTPLFPGWGTHYAYVYAGTPPQRVSVIVDTGSHFTAFPCAECKNCGSHTDPYWDPRKSSTSHVVGCSDCHGSFRCNKNKRCSFSQRYSEGSSWSAVQVEDVIWVGELTLQDSEKYHHDGSAYAVEFMFGCIESQTGLFKTQLADGIMGMSADKHTLVWQLAEAGKIKERVFSLCFSLNGGTMVIGGYDPRLNKRGAKMLYSPTTRPSGWFTVKVEKITLNGVSIAHDSSVFQRGKGTIVDSGTTDTYLPKSVTSGFSKAWEHATGSPYKPCVDNHFCMKLTQAELEALPTLTIHLEGDVEVNVLPQAYMDSLGKDNAYAPRIYMEESMGAVLGANIMRDHNVVFDFDNHRVGFAEGICDYNDDLRKELNVINRSDGPALGGEIHNESVDCVTAKELVRGCDVGCPVGLRESKIVSGHEIWTEIVVTPAQGSGKPCPEQSSQELRPCFKECPAGAPNPNDGKSDGGDGQQAMGGGDGGDKGGGQGDQGAGAQQPVVAANMQLFCPIQEEVWTECSSTCLQERYMGGACEKETEARPCHVGDLCSTSKVGLLLSMKVKLDLVFEAHDRVQTVLGEDGPHWMSWVGTAVADAVAAQLSEVPDGDIEANIAVINPAEAATASEDGKATVACTGVVNIHLTPKVDNNAANRVASALNIPALGEKLTTTVADIRHWQCPHIGFSINVVSTERASMFLASNGEPYLPPVNDRQQASTPQSSDARGPPGIVIMAAAAVVTLAIISVVARVRLLDVPQGLGSGSGSGSGPGPGPGYRGVPQVEMLVRPPVPRKREVGAARRPEEGHNRPFRKNVALERDEKM